MVEVKVFMALVEDNVSKEVCSTPLPPVTKLDVFVKSAANDTKVPIPSVERPWLSKADDFTLPNHDTGRILPPESQRNIIDPPVAITISSATNYDYGDESSVCSTPLPPVTKLDGTEPISGPKTIKSILRTKSTFKAKTLKGVKINEPSLAPTKDNESSPALKSYLNSCCPFNLFLHSKFSTRKNRRPNIILEEYIRLQEEKALSHNETFDWQTTRYGKIKYCEYEDYCFTNFESEFPAIVFDDTLTSDEALLQEPAVSPFNNNEIDFRISFDESEDKDYMVFFDKNLFSYKIVSINNLKMNSENENDKVNMPPFPSPEPMVSYFDNLDFFKDFENEFPAITYNDDLTSKLDPLTAFHKFSTYR
nr:hypothetical protein [Tanacetum cinerariifolium]